MVVINGLKVGDLASAPGVLVLRQSHPSILITTNTATAATNSVRMAPLCIQFTLYLGRMQASSIFNVGMVWNREQEGECQRTLEGRPDVCVN